MSLIAPQFAVVGHPIAHSLSPAIQRAFAAQFGLAIDYTSIDASAAALANVVTTFFAQHGAGLNITVPHKRAVMQLA
ncbi:MAG: shikimate dehydrogenase, partial [Xanthomonadales bacterium]|nr:shikimate dehydrogenase [Xanthomonadales bacterium]